MASTAAIAIAIAIPATAWADPSQGVIGTCTFVSNPTPSSHTVCEGADLRQSVGMIGGLDLDYADLAGANLAGSPLITAASSALHMNLAGADLSSMPLCGLNLTGVSLKGAVLNNTQLCEANLSGADLTGTSLLGSTTLMDSNLTGANLTDAVFGPSTILSGSNLTGAIVTGALLPANLSGANLTGLDFSVTAGLQPNAQFGGSNLTDTKFTGQTIDGFTAGGADFLRASFVGVTFTPGSSFDAGGANFTQANFSGVDFSPLGFIHLDGSPFAFANLSGTTFPLAGGGYYADADLDGAKLFGKGSGAIFHRASMKGVVALHGESSTAPLSFDGAQFHNADLENADLDNTTFSGAQFVDTNLSGAKLQSTAANGLGGVVFIRANLTGAQLPPAKNLVGWDAQKWLYGIYVQDSQITGTSLVNANVQSTSSAGIPTAVTWSLPAAFANTDGELPYGASYDGGYWWGARDTCDHYSGDVFPIGITTVTCAVTFDHTTGVVPWQQPILLDQSAGVPYNYGDPVGAGVTVSGLSAPARAPIARGASLADVNPSGISVDSYKYGMDFFATTAGIYTSSSSTFTVEVDAPPTLGGTLPTAIATQPYSAAITSTGFPVPTISVTAGSLPSGLTLAADGKVTGTPAAGTAGEYAFTVKSTNAAGSTTKAFTLQVVDPAVTVDHPSRILVGDLVTAVGTGFTPGGEVQVWIHSTPTLLGTVTADASGAVTFPVDQLPIGTHHFELTDVATGVVAVSDPFTVTTAALASTGVDLRLWPAALAALLLVLGLGGWAVGRIRRPKWTDA